MSDSASPGMMRAWRRPFRRPRYFYGWNIAGASFLAHICYSEGNSSLLGLYFNPLYREFGWSRTAISGVQSLSRVLEGLVSPLVGPMLDRRGPRALMVTGGVIASLAFIMLTQVHALWQFYVLRGAAIAVGFALMGSMVSNTAVSNWFVRRRGRAIALSTMGSNLGNFILAPLVAWIISTGNWRSSWLLFAFLLLLLVVIPAALVMRRRPEDMGLLPDGDSSTGSQNPGQSAGAISTQRAPVASLQEPVWTRSAVLQTVSFWLLVLSFAVASLALQGINISLAPYAEDLGFGIGIAATVLVVRAAAMLASAPVWGLMSEKADRLIVRILPFAIQALSCVFFLMASQPGVLWLAVIIYGTGMAGTSIIQEVLWANYFGRLTLGTVRSTAFPFLIVFSASGPLLMNTIFDITGSYRVAYLLFLGLFLFASFLMWACRPPGPRGQRT